MEAMDYETYVRSHYSVRHFYTHSHKEYQESTYENIQSVNSNKESSSVENIQSVNSNVKKSSSIENLQSVYTSETLPQPLEYEIQEKV